MIPLPRLLRPTSFLLSVENIENITLNILQDCECIGGSNATLKFADAMPPAVSFTPTYACVDQPFSLKPQLSDGVPPFNFQWNDNSTDTSLLVNIQTPTNFALTITDFCNNQADGSIQINIQDVPTAILSGDDIDYCEGLNDITLPINFNGNPPWSFTYQIDDNAPVTIDSILDDNFNLPISESGNYQLINFTDATCTGDATGTGQVNDIGIKLELESIPLSCPNFNDGQINLNIIAANPPYDINWSPMVNDATNPTNLSAGVYDLMVLDAQNCVFRDSIVIDNPRAVSYTHLTLPTTPYV